MRRAWTIEEDLILAQFYDTIGSGVGPVALGRSKKATTARVGRIWAKDGWGLLCSLLNARAKYSRRMSAHHDRLRALPPDAPDEDWWTRHDTGLTYCWRHCINFKAPRCWLCDASRAATVPSLGHRNDMEA